ncbi:MAG: DUF1566 domain-containing protein [Candidatus Electrothrix sp. AUS1_2]|nr:DUF1566 domain-containing protein [Candidatus Electrothrix sp. AUS1_2]
MRILRISLPLILLSVNAYAIDLTMRLNVEDSYYGIEYGNWSSSYNGYHTGRDYDIAKGTYLESISFGKIVFRYDMPVTTACADGTCSGRFDHGMGRVLEIEYLLMDGAKVVASYNHLDRFEDTSLTDRYVTAKQVVAYSGASGQESNDYYESHLHFEMKTSERNGEITAPWGYSGGDCTHYENGVCPAYRPMGYPDAYGYLHPNDYIDQKMVTLPFLSIETDTPSNTEYDVYGIADEKIYGSLNLTGTFQRSSIVVRDFFSRSQVTTQGNLDDEHRFLGGTNIDSEVDGIKGKDSYQEGDYLFVAYVRDNNEDRFGYPIKFSFVQEGDIIVDNDQLNENLYKYEEITDVGHEGNKIPGYFLTAGLHNGKTEVVYKINTDGQSAVYADGINMPDHSGEWVQLKNSSLEAFDFTAEGYVGITLDSDPSSGNYHIDENHKVAFDAVKFEKVENSNAGILLFLPAILSQKDKIDSSGALNDTGIDWSGNYKSGYNTGCSSSTTPDGDNVVSAQDCSHGRDATHNDDSDGHAGFSFTKLDSNGVSLADQNADYATTPWGCVKDNVTGLIWEVKTDDSGLHDKDDKYTWYNTDPTTNGGDDGYADYVGNTCYGYNSGDASTFCNTEAYVNRVNAARWCGASNWRMPTRKELMSIVDFEIFRHPAVDTDYFPNTMSHSYLSGFFYWTGTPDYSQYEAYYITFHSGASNGTERRGSGFVRLVRSN